jgi:restriction system protein
VKSSKKPEDVTTLRALQGTMQNFHATQGLLVCWGGFTRAGHREARQSYFQIRLWSAEDVVEAIYQNYNRLPDEIQDAIPLEQVWMLVNDEKQ